jgi:hypothetical protein
LDGTVTRFYSQIFSHASTLHCCPTFRPSFIQRGPAFSARVASPFGAVRAARVLAQRLVAITAAGVAVIWQFPSIMARASQAALASAAAPIPAPASGTGSHPTGSSHNAEAAAHAPAEDVELIDFEVALPGRVCLALFLPDPDPAPQRSSSSASNRNGNGNSRGSSRARTGTESAASARSSGSRAPSSLATAVAAADAEIVRMLLGALCRCSAIYIRATAAWRRLHASTD